MRVRLLAVFWLITWMLVLPLFHVHPEADHRHGNDNHIHGGTIHTVFSPDLECEYAGSIHDPACPEVTHQHLQARVHAGHAANHSEIEFSLLSEPTDWPTGKPWVSVTVLSIIESNQVRPNVSFAPVQPGNSPTVLFLSAALPLRAPPFQAI